MNRGATFAVAIGPWGGFYFARGFALRVCLGWVSLTLFPRDIDDVLDAGLNALLGPDASKGRQRSQRTTPP